MRSFNLVGKTLDGTVARIGKDVVIFVDTDVKFSVTVLDASRVNLTTAKGSYTLIKHQSLNIYQGTCNNHKVQVSLKAISGWIKFW